MAVFAAVGERMARRIAEAARRAMQHFGDQRQRAHGARADAGNQKQLREVARPRLGGGGERAGEAARNDVAGAHVVMGGHDEMRQEGLLGLAPRRLELEITESTLLADTAATAATLHALRRFGVRIALDDFGTGYSSLSHLRGFPFDKIKIDRSFVKDLSQRRDCTAIVTAISSLARSLGIATTAEGVETAEQLDFLRAQGCTQAQGFLFSPARPNADLAALLGRINGGEAAAA